MTKMNYLYDLYKLIINFPKPIYNTLKNPFYRSDYMDLKDLKLKKVMYFMQSFVITAGDKTFEVPRSMILNIDISKDYDSMIYPMWYVCINVPLWFYTQISQNPDNLAVSMNLQYTLSPTNETLLSENNPLTTEIAGNFKAVIPHTTQVSDPTVQKEFEQYTNAYNKNYAYNEYAFVELMLYNKAAYAASFNTLNAVLSSTNMTNAVTYCFNRCGISNILMSKADNNKTYNEFKILPQSGIKNIMRIVENYNFHSNGSTLFFDLTESYLVTNKIGCYAWKNNEYKATHILSLSEYSGTMGRFNGVYINTKEKYNVIAIEKESYKSQEVGISPLLKNTGETELFQFATKQALMSMFTPNKEFIVNIDSPNNKKYNGKYRLYAVSVNMTPSGEYLEPQFMITLRR